MQDKKPNVYSIASRFLFDNLHQKNHLYDIIKKTSFLYNEEKYNSNDWKNDIKYSTDTEIKRLKEKKKKYYQQLKTYSKEKKKTVLKVLNYLNINISNYKNREGTYNIPFFLEKLIEAICYEDSTKGSRVSKIICQKEKAASLSDIYYFMTKTLEIIKKDLSSNKAETLESNNAFLYLNSNFPQNKTDYENKISIAIKENEYLEKTQNRISEIVSQLNAISDLLYSPLIKSNNILENLYHFFESNNPYEKHYCSLTFQLYLSLNPF